MPENFPTTPRAPRAVRLGAVAIGLAALALATRTTITSSAWVGRVFPGFVLLDNRVVASIGFGHWSGAAVPGLYQSEVVAVDGRPVESTGEIYARVARVRPGTPVRYRLRRGGAEREVAVAAQRFGLRDWLLLFAAFLLNGAIFLASGLGAWVLRPQRQLARTLLAFGAVCALFMLTAMDLYGPATLFRLHVLGESLLPAAALQLAFVFPQPHPRARWRFAGYGLALAILIPYEVFLYRPAIYSGILTANMAYLGLVGIFFAFRLVSEYWRGRSQLARQRARVIMLGTLFGFTLPGGIVLVSAFVGGGLAMNGGALTPFLFALSLGYAVVKHDLFEIDAMVKRGAYYLVLTGAVGVAYAGTVVLFNVILRAGAITGSVAFPVAFTLAVLLLGNPLRTGLQTFVDRVFFRTTYDAAQILAGVGRELASCLNREQIATLVRDSVDAAIPNARTRLFVTREPGGPLTEVGGDAEAPRTLVARLADGQIVTAFDPVEPYPDARTHEVVRAEMTALGAEIAVPLRLRGETVGTLVTGAKRSGLFYTAGDAEFLRALAHQTAIALENARSYEALVALNARLEERVRERTAELEAANGELADAYAGLKAAEVHLVQSEKMASLGRLVAGVAHEINNPVSFIATNVVPLRRRLTQAAAKSPPGTRAVLREAEEIADIMARGAERTAAIVKDLRNFSRLGEATRKAADLHEGLETSLRLLAPRWRDRITIHREYGELPLVECDPGQMNQVFMNIFANACDAITGSGNLWITTRVVGDDVEVSIHDDGAGIPADVVGRIFDPFFTTKDVGSGTGLGLAISQNVVNAHGGRITVESRPDAGSTFRITLPVDAAAPAHDAAAGGR